MKANSRNKYRKVTAVLSVAAVALLAFGGVTGARAALTYSTVFQSDFGTQDIGVGLVEKTGANDAVSIEEDGALLTKLVGEGETFIVGKKYDEQLMAENTGTIDEYVRMTVHKYWVDGDDKQTDLKPEQIKLTFNESDWIVVDEDKTDETIVLYYKTPLAAGEESVTKAAVTSLTADSSILSAVKQTTAKSDDGTTITTEYAYDGISIGLDAEVDSVQTHHAQDAMLSAWGVNASFSGDTLTAVN